MKKFEKDFFLGAATAAHQVEGNNIHSDYWAMEQLEHSNFKEPSLTTADHYNRFEEDIALLAGAGLNAYRFSIEWARIEPQQGQFSQQEIEHYAAVLQCCHDNGVTPIVTMHHFSSPKWLISQGGWESEQTVAAFGNYCGHVAKCLGSKMQYVCTINEANMGLQIASVATDILRQMGVTLQVGMNLEQIIAQALPAERKLQKAEVAAAFGLDDTEGVNDFLSMRTENGDGIITRAHEAARRAMKAVCPHLKVGLTLSLYDMQPQPGGESFALAEWQRDFAHYLPILQQDDFIGVQNYTRKLFDSSGALPAPEGAEVTDMGYEFYPEGIAHVARRVASEGGIPVMITENGIAATDDTRRQEYIRRALDGVQACLDDDVSILGYQFWSLLDNFEWQEGFAKQFGLITVDRVTQKRSPKESLGLLGSYL